MSVPRRSILAGLGALAPALGATSAVASPTHRTAEDNVTASSDRTPEQLAQDERFWRRVARRFTVTDEFTNLENGYYGIMPDPVRADYHRNVDRLNELNSYLLRKPYKDTAEQLRVRLAEEVGARTGEIALTQSGTEALQNLISGYNRLRSGDAVMYADLDYPDMTDSMDWLRDRRGVDVVTIALPEPATRQAILDTYAAAFRKHPKVKLLLLSHVNNITGLAAPVREIVAMARRHGIDVIVDAAHSWGQLDFTIEDLGADFIGFSLHKWIGAPLGTGFLYIRESRLDSVDKAFADESHEHDDIRSRVVSGTRDVACYLSVPAALEFHHQIGARVKQARLRYLRDRWVNAVADRDNIEILTPNERDRYGAITSFRISGRLSEKDNEDITKYLFERHNIFTVEREGPVKGCCVRVTPALFTLREDVDRLGAALHDVADRFRV